jgi:hypothetical protein
MLYSHLGSRAKAIRRLLRLLLLFYILLRLSTRFLRRMRHANERKLNPNYI